MIHTITYTNHFEEIESCRSLIIVDFHAEWCIPCQIMEPVFKKLSEKYYGKIKFCKINATHESELAQHYQIMTCPNFLFIKDGKVVDQLLGVTAADEFEKHIKNFII